MNAPLSILQFGTTGQIGCAMGKSAHSRGLKIWPLTRAQVDLANADAVYRAIMECPDEICAVVNLAAYTAVDRAQDEPDLAMAINGTAPGIMAKACKKRGIALFHLSTDYVFDGRKKSPYQETDTPNPQSVYGKSKLAAERAIETAGCRHIILRTAWVYAAQGRNFVNTMIELAAHRKTLDIIGDQKGNPTAAPDIAGALGSILERYQDDPSCVTDGVYHFSGRGQASWFTFAKAIFSLMEKAGLPTPVIREVSTRDYRPVGVNLAPRPANSMLDCRKINEGFTIMPPAWETALHTVMSERLERPQ